MNNLTGRLPDEAATGDLPPFIVAVGASAGGLDALRELFAGASADDRLAFVVVTHLPSHHVSHLADLLGRAGPLSAHEVVTGERVRAGQVHVMPPGHWMTLRDGALRLEPRPVDRSASQHPVDHFMRSLADEAGVRGIGIVLSGTDHDGTAGLKAIKAAGGWTMAQAPATAQFPGMPQSAVVSGAVDQVLAPSAMADALRAYVAHQPNLPSVDDADPADADSQARDHLNEILALVLERTGNEFLWYRPGMLRRRLRRRMLHCRCEDVDEYLRLLRESHDETLALAQEFLIGVTEFFRDGDAWAELEDVVLPALLAERRADDAPLRVWTPGCSTGEESYSIAMLLIEAMEKAGQVPDVQVFATDIDLEALAVARQGSYSAAIATAVSPRRLGRFFDRRDEGYTVRKPLRDVVMFAPQNLVRDTPFSRLDLVLCRNVLMYFEPALQDRVVNLFHFALKPGGLLWLGRAESLSGHGAIFQPVSRTARLYRRVGGRAYLPHDFASKRSGPTEWLRRASDRPPASADIVRRHLGDRRVDAAVLVDREGRALFFQGDTGRFVAPQGDATQDLVRLVRVALRPATRNVMRQVMGDDAVGVREVRLDEATGSGQVRVQADALPGPENRGSVLVTFTMLPVDARVALPTGEPTQPATAESELEESRRELALALEDAERSNEELRLAGEEASSLNEELQASNEELESSKEELQSLNEELATVNAQLEDKMLEVARHTDDLSNLLASTQIATLLLDRELRVRRFTPAAAALFSLRPGDEGRLLTDMSSRITDPDFVESARRCMASSVSVDAEVTGPRGRIYLRRLQPFLTDGQGVDGAVATFTDITALRDAAHRLQELISVLRDSNDAVIGLDDDGRILNWNRGAEQIYGYGSQQAKELTLFDLVPDALRDDTRLMVQQAREHGTIGPIDTVRRTRDGRAINASVVISVLRDGHGAIPALLSTERDITERRRIEDEVRFRRLTDDIPALVRVEDRHGMAQFVNRACTEYTGAPSEALLGHGWLEFVVPQDRQRYLAEQARAHPDRGRLELDIRLRRHDGVPRWFRSISVPHVDGDGEFAGYVSLMLDIEDRRRAEMELLQAGRRKDEFLAMLAHELRNPLAPIANAANVLAQPGGTAQTIAWAVGIIERQTLTMSRLLDSLLDVARIARGKTVLQLAPLELRVVLKRAVEVSQASMQARRQSFEMDLGEGGFLLEGDLVRLTQVFGNLLNNASKYTDEGGHIRVTARAAGDDVVVEVADDGAGISAEMLPRIFDLFSQADRTLDRAKGGLGLGLTLVRQLVDLHHGDVQASSPGLGLGSTFTVKLPVLRPSQAPVEAVPLAPPLPGATSGGRRVLVVDDNVDAAQTLAAALGLQGHAVSLAYDGPSALALASRQPFDVVVLDIGLPGMDGYQVARTLRGRSATAGLLILALTGYGQAEDIAMARDAGCDRHFIKPADPVALADVIGKAPHHGR